MGKTGATAPVRWLPSVEVRVPGGREWEGRGERDERGSATSMQVGLSAAAAGDHGK